MLVRDVLEQVIGGFSKDEYENFLSFLQIRTGKKPVVLFELVKQIRYKQKPALLSSNSSNQNLFRLKHLVENFIHHTESNQTHHAIGLKYLNLADFFSRNLNFEQSFHYLQLSYQQFQQSTDVYMQAYTIRQYYHYKVMMAGMGMTPIALKELETLDVQELARVDGYLHGTYQHWKLLDTLSDRLSRNIRVETEKEVDELLATHQRKYQQVISKLSPGVVSIICRSLRDAKRYVDLSKYTSEIWEEINTQRGQDTPTGYDVHFMLDLVRSAYQSHFRTLQFERAKKFMEEYVLLVNRIKTQKGVYNFYLFRSKIMYLDWCLFSGNIAGADQVLQETYEAYKNEKRSNIIYFLLRINAIAVYFCKNEYDRSLSIYNEVMQHYKKHILKTEGLGKEMLMYCECYRAIFYYESGDEDFAIYLASKFLRTYADVKQEDSSAKAILSMRFLLQLCKQQPVNYMIINQQFLNTSSFVPGDKEFISLSAWFRSKMNKTNYYNEMLAQLTA